ncbi:hypothetical protein BHM03_00037638 [Ensete ventricosum]|nr:hypothetical protein BHM03_00037638 [Ensete ventricosum]
MLTWPSRHRALGQLAGRRGKSVWRRYEGVSGRTADLTHIRSTPLTCRRTSHRKDDGHGGEVRRYANRGGHGSHADSESFLKDDDRPGVPFTRIQPRAIRDHSRGFPRPHQPSPSTSGYGIDQSPAPTPARAFDNSPIGSPDGTPANGVTHSPEPGGPARCRAATASGRRSPRSFPDPDASPITKALLRSDTDQTRLRRLIV